MSVVSETTAPLLPAVKAAGRRGRGMYSLEAFHVAVQGLLSNKLRSFLTMLGIIVGVAAVIVMVGLGQGAARATREAIRKLGTNVLYVQPNSQQSRGVSQGLGTAQSLKVEDAEYILRTCPTVKAVSPEYRDGGVTVEYKQNNSRTNVYGTTPDYFEIRNMPIAKGRTFTRGEVEGKARVAVIGDEVREELFGESSPLEKIIRINGQGFEVIGVTARRGGSGWRNPDDQVTMPLSTAMRRLFGKDRLSGISVQAVSEEKMRQAEEEIYAAMAKAHRQGPNDEPDVRMFNQGDLTESAAEQSTFLTMLLAGVALVSLVVGGIGIMNIMLVSVTERTREIGIRKAIGAKRKDILYQFLIESVTLSLVGGLIGIILGVGVGMWMAAPQDSGGLAFPMLLSLPPILISFGFSAVVGVFFGIYPAVKASALNPIEALRYE
jgi:putative ABC transport system permease protein